MKIKYDTGSEKRFFKFAKEGNIKELKRMIWHGEVNPNCQYKERYMNCNRNALYYAMKNGHYELCIYLIKIGLNPKSSGNGIVKTLAHRQHLDILELMMYNGWNRMEIHQIICSTLIGDKQLFKLYKYAEHFKIDPIKIAIESWKNQLDKVTDYYRPNLEARIKNEDILRRDYKIASVIETS